MQVPEGVPNSRVQSQLLEIAQEHCLSQVVNIHTREDKTLDLLLTNSPSPVNRVKRCCHISPDSVNGRRTDRKNTKNVYPVVKVVSVAMKVVAECVRSA